MLWKRIIEKGVALPTENLYDDVEVKLSRCILNMVTLLEHLSYVPWWEEYELDNVLVVLFKYVNRSFPVVKQYQTLSNYHEDWLSLKKTIAVLHPIVLSYGNVESLGKEKFKKEMTEYEGLWHLEEAINHLNKVIFSMIRCLEEELIDKYLLVEHFAISSVRSKRTIQEFFQTKLVMYKRPLSSPEVDFQLWNICHIYKDEYIVF